MKLNYNSEKNLFDVISKRDEIIGTLIENENHSFVLNVHGKSIKCNNLKEVAEKVEQADKDNDKLLYIKTIADYKEGLIGKPKAAALIRLYSEVPLNLQQSVNILNLN